MFKNKFISIISSGVLATSVLVGCGSNNLNFDQINNISSINTFSSADEDFPEFDMKLVQNEDTTYLEELDNKVETSTESTEVSKNATSVYAFVTSSYRLVFSEYDSNRNGVIDLSELKEAPNSFKEMDRDKNNKLSFNEAKPSSSRLKQVSQWVSSFYRGLFKLIDSDNDGRLAYDELMKSEEVAAFKTLSLWKKSLTTIKTRNSSGSISFRQFTTFMNSMFLSLHEKNLRRNNITPRSRSNKKPVILVQGYGEPSWYFMYGIYNNLKSNGWNSIYPVNLFPNITDIKEQANIVASKIEQAKREQNVRKVDYVAHSMGGLIGRYYIQELGGLNSIDNYVSIATPHYGTYTAYLGIGEAAKQMKPGSSFLSSLNRGNPIKGSIKYTSMWTKTDEIVVPAKNAILNGSRVMPDVKYTGHLLIMWVPQAYQQIRDSLN